MWSNILKNACDPVKKYLFFTRNSFFQVVYLILVTSFHVIGIQDGLAAVQTTEPDSRPLPVLIIILFVNIFAFLICCYSDPGIVTKDHNDDLYPYDGQFFFPNVKCPTCNIIKPARSKHCRILNKCIHKFDHYCVLVSNAIGRNNHRYFMFLLATMVIIVVSGCYHLFKAILALDKIFKCWELAKLRSVNGSKIFGLIPTVYLYYVQLLSSNFPRLIVVLICCSTVLPVVSYFLLYHIYLVIKNETTNERYKRWQASRCNHTKLTKKDDIPAHHKPVHRNIYSQGILRNIAEEFFPSWRDKKTN